MDERFEWDDELTTSEAPDEDAVISVTDLTVGYGDRDISRDVSFDIQAGGDRCDSREIRLPGKQRCSRRSSVWSGPRPVRYACWGRRSVAHDKARMKPC